MGSEPSDKAYNETRMTEFLVRHMSCVTPPVARELIHNAFTAVEHALPSHRPAPWPPPPLRKGSNMSVSQQQTVRWFQQSQHLRVSSTDKNLGLAIVEETWYSAQCHIHLLDASTYQKVPSFPYLEVLSACIATSKRNTSLCSKIRKMGTKPCPFYIIPKVHKTPVASRPISAAHSYVTSPLSREVGDCLQKVVHLFPQIVSNSTQVVNLVESQGYNTWCDSDRIFTADVVSLYPSIELQHALVKLPLKCISSIPSTQRAWFSHSLRTVLYNHYVEYDGSVYKQIRGTAMGTPLAPPFANLYMLAIETPVIDAYPEVISYLRFIDDYFFVWRGNDKRLREFQRALNNMHTNIKLTFTELAQSAVFLDLVIMFDTESSRWITRLYRKSINRYLYIPFTSAHTRECLRGWVYGEFVRILRASGCFSAWKSDSLFFITCLCARGYPRIWIYLIYSRLHYGMRNNMLGVSVTPPPPPTVLNDGGPPLTPTLNPNPNPNPNPNLPRQSFLTLRFTPRVDKKKAVRVVENAYGSTPRIAWSYPANLSSRLKRRDKVTEGPSV